METSDLIRTLSRDAKLSGTSTLRTLLTFTMLALAYCMAAIVVIRGLRPDFLVALPWVALKAGVSLLFVASAFPLALRLARPGQSMGAWGGAVIGLFGLAVVTAGAAIFSAAPQDRMAAITGGNFPHCIIIIPMLAIPAGAALFIWFRRYAPTQLALAGAAAGGLAGGLAAMAYALTCPVDSLAFIAIWYSVAVAICAAAGALIGDRTLRW